MIILMVHTKIGEVIQMNNDDKKYASHFIRAWKQYHKLNSHQMNIEGKVNGIVFSWGAQGDGHDFQLLCRKPDGQYQSANHQDKRCLLSSIANKTLQIIGFDTTLNLFLNVHHHLDSQLQKHATYNVDTYEHSL